MSSDDAARLLNLAFKPVSADALDSTISANVATSFGILAPDRTTANKRKRSSAKVGTVGPYSKLLRDLMEQPTDCVGRPIELCRQAVRVHRETVKIIEAIGIPTVSTAGPLAIPIATVDDDNKELVFERAGVPVCGRGEDCIAHMIEGPPNSPLHAYRGPGHDPECTDCLLCVRHEIGMIVQMYRVNGSKPPFGVLPVVCNPVGVPGGYRKSFCAVTPDDISVVSGGVYIMGSPIGFRKAYNPYSKQWYVDQGAAVFTENNFFF
mgnify:CR=1 FL=1